jgi:hypothetical protein
VCVCVLSAGRRTPLWGADTLRHTRSSGGFGFKGFQPVLDIVQHWRTCPCLALAMSVAIKVTELNSGAIPLALNIFTAIPLSSFKTIYIRLSLTITTLQLSMLIAD